MCAAGCRFSAEAGRYVRNAAVDRSRPPERGEDCRAVVAHTSRHARPPAARDSGTVAWQVVPCVERLRFGRSGSQISRCSEVKQSRSTKTGRLLRRRRGADGRCALSTIISIDPSVSTVPCGRLPRRHRLGRLAGAGWVDHRERSGAKTSGERLRPGGNRKCRVRRATARIDIVQADDRVAEASGKGDWPPPDAWAMKR